MRFGKKMILWHQTTQELGGLGSSSGSVLNILSVDKKLDSAGPTFFFLQIINSHFIS